MIGFELFDVRRNDLDFAAKNAFLLKIGPMTSARSALLFALMFFPCMVQSSAATLSGCCYLLCLRQLLLVDDC